ncbi:hypothetical protein HDU97_006812 [Phlyctochytrium planicorne]|nr:hypothetical protein HDU97_006812 [Phlyctochytrium planicorne]
MKFSAIIFTATALLAATADARLVFGDRVDLEFKLQEAGCGNLAAVFGNKEIPTLQAEADPCDKIRLADSILAAAAKACPKSDAFDQVVDAAMDLTTAEKDFAPFIDGFDSVCLDKALPANPILQGLLQFVDPQDEDRATGIFIDKAQAVLDKAKAAKKGPGNGGKSMAQLAADNGFTDIQGINGNKAPFDRKELEKENAAIEKKNAANKAKKGKQVKTTGGAKGKKDTKKEEGVAGGVDPSKGIDILAPFREKKDKGKGKTEKVEATATSTAKAADPEPTSNNLNVDPKTGKPIDVKPKTVKKLPVPPKINIIEDPNEGVVKGGVPKTKPEKDTKGETESKEGKKGGKGGEKDTKVEKVKPEKGVDEKRDKSKGKLTTKQAEATPTTAKAADPEPTSNNLNVDPKTGKPIVVEPKPVSEVTPAAEEAAKIRKTEALMKKAIELMNSERKITVKVEKLIEKALDVVKGAEVAEPFVATAKAPKTPVARKKAGKI